MDNISKLREYKELLDQGIITPEQFNEIKKGILNNIESSSNAQPEVSPIRPSSINPNTSDPEAATTKLQSLSDQKKKPLKKYLAIAGAIIVIIGIGVGIHSAQGKNTGGTTNGGSSIAHEKTLEDYINENNEILDGFNSLSEDGDVFWEVEGNSLIMNQKTNVSKYDKKLSDEEVRDAFVDAGIEDNMKSLVAKLEDNYDLSDVTCVLRLLDTTGNTYREVEIKRDGIHDIHNYF